MKKILLSFFLAVTLLFSGCSLSVKYEALPPVTADFEVHYIDVGQASSSLIISGDETMLIDGGNAEDGSLIVSYLKKQGINHLDYVICSHAHEDHVGGLSGPLNAFLVDEVYAPETESDIKAYTNFKKAALNNAGGIKNPETGETVELGESVVTFLGPIGEDPDDLNNTSIILRAVFGETSFLFTGDAERQSELKVIDSGAELKSTVLLAGHHGSSTSNSYVFLRAVMPRYAVISAGAGNDYGHPHDEVLSRFKDADVETYRTDLQGTVIAYSDGKEVTFKTDKSTNDVFGETSTQYNENTESSYIGNKNSKKFHCPSCNALPAEKNSVYFETRNEAVESGYSPCGGCEP